MCEHAYVCLYHVFVTLCVIIYVSMFVFEHSCTCVFECVCGLCMHYVFICVCAYSHSHVSLYMCMCILLYVCFCLHECLCVMGFPLSILLNFEAWLNQWPKVNTCYFWFVRRNTLELEASFSFLFDLYWYTADRTGPLFSLDWTGICDSTGLEGPMLAVPKSFTSINHHFSGAILVCKD